VTRGRAARAHSACACALGVGVGIAASLAAPRIAAAQTPIDPNAPTPPTNLNPTAPGNQAPAPRPKAPSPGVVVVGPDGKIVGDTPAGGTYYVPPSGGNADANGDTYQGPDVTYAGPVPELHVVRSGDTLWDLCWFYFNDPWQWPKIWSYNAQITNPHWIYPGDLVRLLPRGVFTAVQPSGPDPEPGTAPKPRQPDPVPAPQRRIESSLTTTAFVEKSDLDRSITVVGSVDEKVLLGIGDDIYMTYPKDRPPEVGKRYSIYVPGRAVKSGANEYGSYVRLLGTVQILSVKDGKLARGQIVEANQEIERGAKVGPLLTKFRNVPPVAPKLDLQGSIVAMLTRDQMIGDRGEIVFVNLGKGSGLEVGNRMYVVRRGDALPDRMSSQIGSDDRRFPARALGEVVIVEIGDKVSIGVVTLSVQEMSVGDLVMMQRPK
jgi:hypothetical protein